MKNILVINLGGIGDVLLSTPAMRALRDLYPQAEMYMLIAPRVYDFVANLPYIDKVFVFDVGYGGVITLGKLFKNLNVLLTLRRKKFGLAINMRTLVSEKSAKKIKLLLDIIKPKMKVGRDTEARGSFFDVKIPETGEGQKYEMEYDLDTVEALGAEVTDKSIDFAVDLESLKKIDVILESEGISKTDILIGIHPGGMPSRRWPVENFAEIINEINRKLTCKFVVTGGKDEVRLTDKLIKMTNAKVLSFAGILNFYELIALIKRCNLYISNDTGPMHIAAILKTPLVAILGPGDITRYDPRNISDKAVVLYKKIECAPCNQVRCKDLKCLEIISPEEVIGVIRKLLNI